MSLVLVHPTIVRSPSGRCLCGRNMLMVHATARIGVTCVWCMRLSKWFDGGQHLISATETFVSERAAPTGDVCVRKLVLRRTFPTTCSSQLTMSQSGCPGVHNEKEVNQCAQQCTQPVTTPCLTARVPASSCDRSSHSHDNNNNERKRDEASKKVTHHLAPSSTQVASVVHYSERLSGRVHSDARASTVRRHTSISQDTTASLAQIVRATNLSSFSGARRTLADTNSATQQLEPAAVGTVSTPTETQPHTPSHVFPITPLTHTFQSGVRGKLNSPFKHKFNKVHLLRLLSSTSVSSLTPTSSRLSRLGRQAAQLAIAMQSAHVEVRDVKRKAVAPVLFSPSSYAATVEDDDSCEELVTNEESSDSHSSLDGSSDLHSAAEQRTCTTQRASHQRRKQSHRKRKEQRLRREAARQLLNRVRARSSNGIAESAAVSRDEHDNNKLNNTFSVNDNQSKVKQSGRLLPLGKRRVATRWWYQMQCPTGGLAFPARVTATRRRPTRLTNSAALTVINNRQLGDSLRHCALKGKLVLNSVKELYQPLDQQCRIMHHALGVLIAKLETELPLSAPHAVQVREAQHVRIELAQIIVDLHNDNVAPFRACTKPLEQIHGSERRLARVCAQVRREVGSVTSTFHQCDTFC